MRAKPEGPYAVDCSTFFNGCEFCGRGEDSDEAAQSLVAHVKTQHGQSVTLAMAARVRAAVRHEGG